MNYPPIFATCRASSAVTAILGASPTRLFLFGEAPQNVALPYATWQITGGTPENYLDTVPDIDRYSVQVDVWAETASDARDAAGALLGAIEPVAHVVSWRGEGRAEETELFRLSFDVDWFAQRL